MQVPPVLLNKPGRLTEEEMQLVHSHAEFGYRMLVAQGSFSADILDVVRHHHEKLDGSGYPEGLSGRAIRNVVRMVTICDIYGALIEPRAYRPSLSPPEALQIMAGMNEALDPDLFASFQVLAPMWTRVSVPLLFALRRRSATTDPLPAPVPGKLYSVKQIVSSV